MATCKSLSRTIHGRFGSSKAREYCALVECDETRDQRAFLERCLKLLLSLFSLALELPDAEGHLGGSRVANEEYRAVVQRMRARLTSDDAYWMVLDPLDSAQPEAIRGSISDDLADIWRDLKCGLLVASKGNLANAVCEWRFSFETHWAPFHASHVIRPLFGLLFTNKATRL